ncbi:hypothetical protein DYB31_008692 [Aphanomyces astaci]|uniref:Uncharacterized protein n=1 Tax=Aphanomyces astaci TaxID=112090 RepID=A0A397FSX0_APHAT|nr:hypothetical protein DYB31_008692 [Aphanomyces astaci]
MLPAHDGVATAIYAMALFLVLTLVIFPSTVHGERYPSVTAACSSASTRAASECSVPSTPLTVWTPPSPSGLLYWATLVGDWTWSLLNHTRGLSDDWYRNALRSLVVAKCVHDLPYSSRCVSVDSDVAANASCVRLLDPGNCYDQALCERVESCRWMPPSASSTASRGMYFTDAEGDAATLWATETYPTSVAPYALLGLVLAAVVLISILVFVVMRFGCDRCYGTTPLRKGYTTVDRWLPISAVVVSTGMLVGLGLLVFLLSPAYLRGINQTLDTLQATATSVLQIQTDLSRPLADLTASVRLALIDSASTSSLAHPDRMLHSVSQAAHTFINQYAPSTVGAFPSYACQPHNSSAAALPPYASASNMPCIPCPDAVCADAPRQLDAILMPLIAASDEVQSLAQWTFNQVDVADADGADEALAALSALGSAAAMFAASTSPRLQYILGHIQLGGFGAVLAMFVVAMTSSVLALMGIVHGLRSPTSGCLYVLHVSWILAVAFAVVGFAASGVLLAASVVGNDMCMYLTVVLQNPDPFLPRPAAALVRSCSTPLTTTAADDVARALVGLHLDHITRLGCVLHTGLLASNASIHNSLTQTNSAAQRYADQLTTNSQATAFANDGLMRFLVAQAGTAAGVTWNSTTFMEPWKADGLGNATQPCSSTSSHPALCYMYARCKGDTKCFDKYETAYAYRVAHDEIQAVAVEMQQAYNTTTPEEHTLMHQVRVLEAALRVDSTTQLNQLRQGPLGDVARRGRGLQCVSSVSCGFVRTNTAKLQHYFCKDTLRFTVLAAVALFIASGFYLSLALATLMLQKRLQGRVKMMWWKRRSVVARQNKLNKQRRRLGVSTSISSSDPPAAGPPPRPVRPSGLVMMSPPTMDAHIP